MLYKCYYLYELAQSISILHICRKLPFITGIPSFNSIMSLTAKLGVPFVIFNGLLTIFLLYLHNAASLNTFNISLTRAAYPANATNSYNK